MNLLLESLDCFNSKITHDGESFKTLREKIREITDIDMIKGSNGNINEEMAQAIKDKAQELYEKLCEDKEIASSIEDRRDFGTLIKAKIIMMKKKKNFNLVSFDKEEMEFLIDAVDCYQYKLYYNDGDNFRNSMMIKFFADNFPESDEGKEIPGKVEFLAMFKKHFEGKDYRITREAISILKAKLILTMQDKTIDDLFNSPVES